MAKKLVYYFYNKLKGVFMSCIKRLFLKICFMMIVSVGLMGTFSGCEKLSEILLDTDSTLQSDTETTELAREALMVISGAPSFMGHPSVDSIPQENQISNTTRLIPNNRTDKLLGPTWMSHLFKQQRGLMTSQEIGGRIQNSLDYDSSLTALGQSIIQSHDSSASVDYEYISTDPTSYDILDTYSQENSYYTSYYELSNQWEFEEYFTEASRSETSIYAFSYYFRDGLNFESYTYDSIGQLWSTSVQTLIDESIVIDGELETSYQKLNQTGWGRSYTATGTIEYTSTMKADMEAFGGYSFYKGQALLNATFTHSQFVVDMNVKTIVTPITYDDFYYDTTLNLAFNVTIENTNFEFVGSFDEFPSYSGDLFLSSNLDEPIGYYEIKSDKLIYIRLYDSEGNLE
jgi:hypothetical protein